MYTDPGAWSRVTDPPEVITAATVAREVQVADTRPDTEDTSGRRFILE